MSSHVEKSRKALGELMDAASELADRAKTFATIEPKAAAIDALCAGIAGIILNPGGWETTVEPSLRAVVSAVGETLPDMEEQLRLATN